jgi:subtilisin family serine protease
MKSRRSFQLGMSCCLAFTLALLLTFSVSYSSADSAPIDGDLRKVISNGGYESLVSKIASDGKIRILVNLNVPFKPMGRIHGADAESQMENISVAQNSLLESLAGHDLTGVHKYKYIPVIAVIVDRETLGSILSSSLVSSVEEDIQMRHFLDQSVPLIGVPAVFAEGYTGAGMHVAVLDTGVDKTHTFLAGAVVSEACYSTNKTDSSYEYVSHCPGGVSSSTASGSAMPYAGACYPGECDHGTHVAGIAAGRDNGSFSGVAKGAGVIAIQVFTRVNYKSSGNFYGTTSFFTDLIKGLERVYALRNTYDIASVNMSLGGGYYSDYCDSTYTSVKTAIDNLRSAGIASVIASGNDYYYSYIAAPACISTAVSVGATTDYDTIAYFSNSASFLSLLAPGYDIYSSIPGGSYANKSGTSMATPHVAGSWALLKQSNPAASVPDILTALQSTGVAITDTRNNVTTSRIQVDEALAAVPCYNEPVLKKGTTSYYSSIQSGYNALSSGQTALVRETELSEVLLLAGSSPAKLEGGYNCDFSSITGFTTLEGSMTIKGAAVTVANFIIK